MDSPCVTVGPPPLKAGVVIWGAADPPRAPTPDEVGAIAASLTESRKYATRIYQLCGPKPAQPGVTP